MLYEKMPYEILRSWLNNKFGHQTAVDNGNDLLRDLKKIPVENRTSRIVELIGDLESVVLEGSLA